MTIISFRLNEGLEVKAKVRIYKSSRNIEGKEYEVINAYIPLPSFVKFMGFDESKVKVIVLKGDKYDKYESTVRRVSATRYGVTLLKSTIERLDLKNDDEVVVIVLKPLTKEYIKEGS